MKEIIDLDSGSAVTLFSFVDISREKPNEEFGVIDLENYISQAIWKLFDKSREDAIGRLGIEEADMILTDARVMGIKIDGHSVINPKGFTGKKLEILLGITMVRRDQFVEDAHLLEGGSVRSYLLAKELGFSDAIYVEVKDDKTTLFSVAPTGVTYMSDFDWGEKNILDALQSDLQVLPSAADGIYRKRTEGMVSDHIARRIDKTFYGALEDFTDGLTKAIKDSASSRKNKLAPVYMRSFFPMPEGIRRKRFAYNDKRITLLSPVGEEDLSAFVDDEVHDIYDELNQLARRRIKWLIPTT